MSPSRKAATCRRTPKERVCFTFSLPFLYQNPGLGFGKRSPSPCPLPRGEGNGAHGVTRPTFLGGPLLHLFVIFAVRDFSDGYDELHRAGGALNLFPQLPG